MSEEYTVPALRDTANDLRAKAAQHYAAEEIRARQLMEAAKQDADAMVAAAIEIDKLADGQMDTGPEPAFTMPCWSCRHPIAQDALGWGHVRPDETACQVPGPDEHTATRTPAAGTVVDGPGVTGEVAQ